MQSVELKNREESSDIIDLFLRISENMVSSEDEASFMTVTLEDIGHVLSADRVYIFDYKVPNWYNSFEWTHEKTASVQHLFQGVNFDYMSQLDTTMQLFRQGKLQIIENIQSIESTEERDFFAGQSIESMIAMPLIFEGDIVGMFGLERCKYKENWVDDIIDVVETLGYLLNNAKAHFKAQQTLEAEEKIAQHMIDALPVPLYLVNPKDFTLILWNKTFVELVGAENLHKGKCYKVLHDFYEPCSFCGLFDTEIGSSKVWQHHNEVFNSDFTIIASRVSWDDVEDAYAVAFIDITDSLMMQREQVLEREAMKTKARFLANMSHELRTPVNGIMGMTNLAEKNTSDPVVQEYLQKIKFSSSKLLETINNILDFSKIEAGKMEIEYSFFTIDTLVQRIQQEFSELATQKGLELQIELNSQVPTCFMGDSLRIYQIMQNFVSNAIKFTETGSVSVKISASPFEQGAPCCLEICVTDTGIGMSQAHIERLFDIFFLVDESFTRTHGGTGVGLPLTQGLITLMQGNLTVESTLGGGSTFLCTLPLTVASEEQCQSNVPKADFTSAEGALQGKKLLLAEDNEINGIIAREMLESFGCSVDIAVDGIEALQLLAKKSYDAILMDMEMPRMNGFEATEKIRSDAHYDRIPIIGMSAHTAQDIKNHSELKGMQGYVMKPFEAKGLYETLCAYITDSNDEKTA